MMNTKIDKLGISLESVRDEARAVFKELLEVSQVEKGDILIVGCSSSEVQHKKIGTFSSEEIGQAIFEELYKLSCETGLYLAAQCCEHLNRALIVEKECAKAYGLARVNVVPQLKAGGSFATAAMKGLKEAVAVESLYALAALGIDIGDTLIGMHLREVAVPVRTTTKSIGAARVVSARTRYKYVGGPRASYDESLG